MVVFNFIPSISLKCVVAFSNHLTIHRNAEKNTGATEVNLLPFYATSSISYFTC